MQVSISMTGEGVPRPEGTPFPPASSIHLTGTNVLTDTRSDALGGKIELKASGPIQLQQHDHLFQRERRPSTVRECYRSRRQY